MPLLPASVIAASTIDCSAVKVAFLLSINQPANILHTGTDFLASLGETPWKITVSSFPFSVTSSF